MKRPLPKEGLKPTRVSPPGERPRPAPRSDSAARPRSDGPGGGRGFRKNDFRPDQRPPREGGWEARGINIVHEDADLLIVDKPSGLLTANMPDETRDSLFDRVKEYAKSARRSRKPARVWIIHRLDKEASGLLVFAKTEKAFHWLKEDFKAKRVKRLYAAVVEGRIGAEPAAGGGGGERREAELPSGTIQSFISEDEFGNSRSLAVGDTARNTGPEARRERWAGKKSGPPRHAGEVPDKPQLAVTHYRVIAYGNGRTLVQLRLDTGRKNQIRLHMKEMSHPIIGDRRYGAATDPIKRVALHATDLGFTHPSTGQSVRFVSPAPPGFYRAIGMDPPTSPSADRPVHARATPAENVSGSGSAPPDRIVQPQAPTSWDHVAQWYDHLLEEGRSDHFQQVIIPGTLHLLKPLAGMRVLDIACGQGHLCRRMAELGLDVTGVDASPRLIETARQRAEGLPIRLEVADARDLAAAGLEAGFDAATCIMALMNIEPMEPVLRGAAAMLKPGGSLVMVILHPAFRAPGQTSWGWDESAEAARGRKNIPSASRARSNPRQFRRVDGYLSPGQVPITMNPGRAAHGAEEIQTWTFHRPMQTYIKSLSDAGFLIESLEEWPSQRTSQPGPRAAEENRARREIPMFLGIRAITRYS